MTYSLKLKHILTLIAGSTIVAVASTNVAAQEPAEKPTLMQCHKLLPKGVQYNFEISSDIDTRDRQETNMTISLADAEKPNSDEIPAGAGEFWRCVEKVVGDDKDWPDV